MILLHALLIALGPHLGSTETNQPLKSRRYLKQKEVEQFGLWSSATISFRVQKWASHYPDLIRVTTAQEAYGLLRAGGPDDCPHDEGGNGCLNYILTIQDFIKHPEGSPSSNRLPEVLWSGEGKSFLILKGERFCNGDCLF